MLSSARILPSIASHYRLLHEKGSAYSAVRWKSIENLPTGSEKKVDLSTSLNLCTLNISSPVTVLLPRKFVLVRRDPHHFAGPEQVIRFNLDGIFNIPEDKHEGVHTLMKFRADMLLGDPKP
ncbi:hypothetical protein PGT21_024971 [Puccinia graminis f. sp. tritici]|uniref:Uncharacterized protein n=1 Tax=Puccinia graminis f. sp. tritici TaxID=56615 RepID=A0A5B0N6H1_PUCGR|nr:hypothetical protein PGT21_024971 [Puccinia graminis f. sp. tritici]